MICTTTGGVMDLLIGAVAYIVLLAGFALFGRFMKDCDDELFEQIKAIPFSKKHAN